MVWGGISLGGRTALHVLARGSLTAIRYRDEILRPIVRPYAGAVGPGFLLMQDNARPHVAGVCQQFLQDEGIDAMDWPARSPDLNPIEHIWDIMSRSIHQRHVAPQTVQELADALVQVWEEIPQETIRHLIRSMPRRCREVIQSFQALGDLPVFTDSYDGLDMLSEFVTARKDELKNMCDKERRELFGHWEENRLSKMPRMREIIPLRKYFLTKYKNSTVEVDPNTVAACLCLSDKNREISWGKRDQAHHDHPDRFTFLHQALCKKGLRGIHYWEVEWDGGDVDLAVSYKGIARKGSWKECGFGHNNLSWKLNCTSSGCTFWHNNLYRGRIPPVLSRRVGIHLDYKAGTLAFYSVSDTLTQLHQVRTTFTERLYPGFSVDLGATLKICKM
uniref:tripartite motif-containing protein 16-like protein n=1 Tax=Epinephelus lanceolatus TaxID=310571 RepID=UPI001446CD7D|nr:tripartite motif-containing protein 16-like protein [Epinephelus lanceolatus]